MSDAPPEFRPPPGPRVPPRFVGLVAGGLAGLAVLVALVSSPVNEPEAQPSRPEAPSPAMGGPADSTWPGHPTLEDPLDAATRSVQEAVAARARAEITLERARAVGADPDVLEALGEALGAARLSDEEGPAQLDAAGPSGDAPPEDPRPGASERAL